MIRVRFSPAAFGWARGLLVFAAAVGVFCGSLGVPFVFDDVGSIVSNPAIRRLWPPWGWMGGTRPVVELTLAVNYALGGLSAWGYHLFNVVLHGLVAVLVADVGRLVLESAGGAWAGRGKWVGFWAGLIFAVHPLQSEAVTYVISRSELLVGFWYLLVVDLSVRGMMRREGRRWEWVAAVVCSVVGMCSKEVMVTAPVMVWWVDVSVVSGGFRGWVRGIRERVWLYAGLVSSWGVLGYLLRTREHVGVGGSVGIGWDEYLATELGVVVHYLRLYVWPVGLTLDYDWPVAGGWMEAGVLVPGLVLVGLVIAGIWLVVRGSGEWGVWIGWVLGVLVPTSTVYPIADLVFEHRMYLSVAGLAMLTVMAVDRGLWWRGGKVLRASVVVCGLLVLMVLGASTVLRNRVWQDPIMLWRDTVSKAPLKARPRSNLAHAYEQAGMFEKAFQVWQDEVAARERYLRRHPDEPNALLNLANAYAMVGKTRKGIETMRRAIELASDQTVEGRLRVSLGGVLVRAGELKEGAEELEAGISLMGEPGRAEDKLLLSSARSNLGWVYANTGLEEKAVAVLKRSIALDPANVAARSNLGWTLAMLGRLGEARAILEEAVGLGPSNPAASSNLGWVLASLGDLPEARKQLEKAVSMEPREFSSHGNLGWVCLRLGDLSCAKAQLEFAGQMKPGNAWTQHMLGVTYSRMGRWEDAELHLQKATELAPESEIYRRNLALAKLREVVPIPGRP